MAALKIVNPRLFQIQRHTSLRCLVLPLQPRYFSSHQIYYQQAAGLDSDENAAYQMGSLIGRMKHQAAIYLNRGMVSKNLYEHCADDVPYDDFFKACNMPDTFQSWFLVMQLHLWMILVRLRPEGKQGKRISYTMVEMMWLDVEARIKLLGLEDTSERKETLEELTQQFFGLIIAYDEGILSHDRVLASALWRNLFHNKAATDPENLASLVGYVRKQVKHLDDMNSNELLLYGKINWLPINRKSKEKS